jgi:hypothetical protein
MKRRWVAALLACGLTLGGCAAAVTPPDMTAPPEPAGQAAQPAEQTQPAPLPAAQEPAPKRPHVDIHGIYMTGWTAGSDRFYELVEYMERTGLNAVVLDVQDDDGHISWETEIPLALEIGAHESKIPDIDKRLQYLREKGIYTIGRIVVYADPLLGNTRPDMAILGGHFVDTRGIRWPDPYNKVVWEYKVAIAKEAAARGFDEIQFDYIRFPEHRIEGYNYKVEVAQRVDAIIGFLRYARQELEPYGVYLAADVFGLTTTVADGDDMEIGQDYVRVAEVVDYVLPMVYPSHYAPGTYGVANPNYDPGRIVYESLVGAQKRTWGMDPKLHRPWIQDFDYGKEYTAADVEAQIRGLAEAGIYQWILWDPSNRYTQGVNYGLAGKNGPPGAWRAAYEQQRQQVARQVIAEAIRLGRTVE